MISERPITRAEVILKARVVGGFPMLDGGEADDKILAVLDNDDLWDHVHDLSELPVPLVDRLRHYFLTYKTMPDDPQRVVVDDPYGREHAEAVIRAAMEDYEHEYGS